MWKNRIKTTSFWIGLSSVAILIADYLGNLFGFSICPNEISKGVFVVCSCLIAVGFVNKKNVNDKVVDKQELLDDINVLHKYADKSSDSNPSNLSSKSDNVMNKYSNNLNNNSESNDKS